MKYPAKMTNDQIIDWLNKTRSSISNFVSRGGAMNTDRGYDLLDRYGELLDEAQERNHHNINLWNEYCDSMNLSHYHDQYDLFA